MAANITTIKSTEELPSGFMYDHFKLSHRFTLDDAEDLFERLYNFFPRLGYMLGNYIYFKVGSA